MSQDIVDNLVTPVVGSFGLDRGSVVGSGGHPHGGPWRLGRRSRGLSVVL